MVFGRLTVTGRQYAFSKVGQAHWRCKCECGNASVVKGSNLRSGVTKSCGCLKDDLNRTTKTKHGKRDTSTYLSWVQMNQRCNNPKSTSYADYGVRGIAICERWQSFELFLEDMGDRPFGKSLDRKDTNGNYEPSNCKWSTAKEQANNRRIRQVSRQRERDNSTYGVLRKEFLDKYTVCPVTGQRTTQIHHSAKRTGGWQNLTRYWIAVSLEGHAWIEANKREAETRGLMVRIVETYKDHVASLNERNISLTKPLFVIDF